MEQIRSFVAIELPDELKRTLTQLQAQLKLGNQAPVKLVDPSGIHLTLKFLGNISTDMASKVGIALKEATRGVSPFQLEAKGLGVFPNLKQVQVVWVGLTGDLECLGQLQRNIDSALENLGFKPESRLFTPHLTLARIREQATPAERQNLGEIIASSSFDIVCPINVDSIDLMRSQLTRQGAIYSRLFSIKLK